MNLAIILGAHIPDLSSEVEFFDLLYLGAFVILSSAFDHRFYDGQKPPSSLSKEIAYAVRRFNTLIHIFSRRFIIDLEGEVVSPWYVVNRILGEFAAASVVLANAIHALDEIESNDNIQYRVITNPCVRHIEGILQMSYPDVFPYYSRCVARGHKDFLWTGPRVNICLRSEGITTVVALTGKSEMIDLPSHRIYTEDVDLIQPNQTEDVSQSGKRPGDTLILEDEKARKRSRQS